MAIAFAFQGRIDTVSMAYCVEHTGKKKREISLSFWQIFVNTLNNYTQRLCLLSKQIFDYKAINLHKKLHSTDTVVKTSTVEMRKKIELCLLCALNYIDSMYINANEYDDGKETFKRRKKSIKMHTNYR